MNSDERPADRAENPALRRFRGELRRRLISAREALSAADHAEASRHIRRSLEALLTHLAPKVLGFCWPYRAEFDCRQLVERQLEGGARAVLPVVVAPRAPMLFREWRPERQMVADRYGIHVPREGATLTPDVILMPVNAFDSAGFRLGYGGGYFDRTLAALEPRPSAVGIGFELARVASVDPQPYDVPLDYVVTEAGCFRVGPTGLIADR